MQTTWGYSYSKGYRENISQLSSQPVVENISRERANSISATANLAYVFSDKGYVQLQMQNSTDFYKTEYGGYSSFTSHQTQGMAKLALLGSWQPSNKFYLGILPGISIVYRTDHTDDRILETTPTVSIYTQWYPVEKLFLRLSGGYATTQPFTSTTADAMIRQSTLFWFKGNPSLKSWQQLRGDFTAMYMLADWLTPSVNLFYLRTFHDTCRRYYAASEAEEGIVEEYFNAAPEDHIRLSTTLSGNYFNRALTVSLSPTLAYTKTRSSFIGDRTLTRFYMYGSVGYKIGNFGFDVSYETSQKMISDAGQVTEYRPDRWNFSASYGNGNLYVSVGIDNIFHTTDVRPWLLDSKNYSYDKVLYQTGRSFSVNLTYTFGYGKKVGQSIQIDMPDGIKSGASRGL